MDVNGIVAICRRSNGCIGIDKIIHTYTYIYIHTCIHIHIYTCIYTYTYIHTHIYTHIQLNLGQTRTAYPLSGHRYLWMLSQRVITITHITTDGSNNGSLGQQMFDMSA